MRRLLSASRYLVVIAVAGSFVASLTLMVYGGLETVLAGHEKQLGITLKKR